MTRVASDDKIGIGCRADCPHVTYRTKAGWVWCDVAHTFVAIGAECEKREEGEKSDVVEETATRDGVENQ